MPLSRGGSTADAWCFHSDALVPVARGRSFRDVARKAGPFAALAPGGGSSDWKDEAASSNDAHDQPTLTGTATNFVARSAQSAGLLRRPVPAMCSRCGASGPDEEGRMSSEDRWQGIDGRPRSASTAGLDCGGSAGSRRKMPRGSCAQISEPSPATGPTIIGRPRRQRRRWALRSDSDSAAPARRRHSLRGQTRPLRVTFGGH